MSVARRYSGLQKEVLNLYRSYLKAIATKAPEAQPAFRRAVRKGFDEHREIAKTDVTQIEYYLRKGMRSLETIRSPHCQRING